MKMTAGSSLAASVKMARMNLLASPYHLLMMADAVTLMKKHRDSAASALASIVLPAGEAAKKHQEQQQSTVLPARGAAINKHQNQYNRMCCAARACAAIHDLRLLQPACDIGPISSFGNTPGCCCFSDSGSQGNALPPWQQ
jgi:hypothetical protein